MKAYTDIEQSKKLAEMLSIESADMFWADGERPAVWNNKDISLDETDIPAWSFVALLEVIPYSQVNFISLPSNGENLFVIQVLCGEEWKFGNWKSNPIDACVEMIFELKEKDLL